VARLRELLGREGGTLLDVACGTGRHLEVLRQHYRAEGLDLDPAMVEIARSRGLTVHEGDLAAFHLGRTFDVVTCLFSSIGYVPSLEAGVRNLARHVTPGGVLAVEPWLTPETVVRGHLSLHTAEDGSTQVARMSLVEVEGRVSRVDFHHLVGRQGSVEYFHEVHRLWLWSRDEYGAAFLAAGLDATYDEQGLMGRGLWVATRGR
jgi:SAM-dependent methyltransferase